MTQGRSSSTVRETGIGARGGHNDADGDDNASASPSNQPTTSEPLIQTADDADAEMPKKSD